MLARTRLIDMNREFSACAIARTTCSNQNKASLVEKMPLTRLFAVKVPA